MFMLWPLGGPPCPSKINVQKFNPNSNNLNAHNNLKFEKNHIEKVICYIFFIFTISYSTLYENVYGEQKIVEYMHSNDILETRFLHSH